MKYLLMTDDFINAAPAYCVGEFIVNFKQINLN